MVIPDRADHAAGQIHLLGGDALSPAQARAIVGDALATLPEATVAVAQLLTSELVTNAVVHARTDFELEIAITESGPRITVQDCSSAAPQRRPPSVDLASGRGLALVAGLSSAWGWELTPSGKRVWFELGLANATTPG